MNKYLTVAAMMNNGKIESLKNTVVVAIDTLQKTLNNKNGLNQGKAKMAVDNAFSMAKKAVKAYNDETALLFYRTHDLNDIVTGGKAVPVVNLKVSENEDGAFSVSLEKGFDYPKCSAMVKAGVMNSNVVDKIDLLRREVAYLKSGKNDMFLTGDIENNKDIPNDNVKALIEGEGEISKNKAKATLAVVLYDITGGEYRKTVFTNLFNDFCEFMTKRTGEWGERAMVSKSTACDIVLEYAYMYFNNMREVKYTIA